MIIRYLVGLVLFLLLGDLYAQKDLNIPVNHRVILNFQESVVYADVLTTDNKIKLSDDLYYYWFSANDVKRTRGGFDGKLLHGNFTEFYLNKNLKEKGQFKYGLKNGEWKNWYLNGELKEIAKWKKGKQHGEYRLFNEAGQLIEKGTYRNGLFNGKIYKYTSNGTMTFEKYKKGVLKKKKERKRKGFLFFKRKEKSTKEVRPNSDKVFEERKKKIKSDSLIFTPNKNYKIPHEDSSGKRSEKKQIKFRSNENPQKPNTKKKEEFLDQEKPRRKRNAKS